MRYGISRYFDVRDLELKVELLRSRESLSLVDLSIVQPFQALLKNGVWEFPPIQGDVLSCSFDLPLSIFPIEDYFPGIRCEKASGQFTLGRHNGSIVADFQEPIHIAPMTIYKKERPLLTDLSLQMSPRIRYKPGKVNLQLSDLALWIGEKTLMEGVIDGEVGFHEGALRFLDVSGKINNKINDALFLDSDSSDGSTLDFVAYTDFAISYSEAAWHLLKWETQGSGNDGAAAFVVKVKTPLLIDSSFSENWVNTLSGNILSFDIADMPLSLMDPLLSEYSIQGGRLFASSVVRAEKGQFVMIPSDPFYIEDLSIRDSQATLFDALNIKFSPRILWDGKRLEVHVNQLGVNAFNENMLAGEVMADMVIRPELRYHHIKSELNFSLNGWGRQPILLTRFGDLSGKGTCQMEWKGNAPSQLNGRLVLQEVKRQSLKHNPFDIRLSVEGSSDHENRWHANVLSRLKGDAGESDLYHKVSYRSLSGNKNVELMTTGKRVFADDFQALAAVFSQGEGDPVSASKESVKGNASMPLPSHGEGSQANPFWQGWIGEWRANVKEVIYDQKHFHDVATHVLMRPKRLLLKFFKTRLVDSQLNASGNISYRANSSEPYAVRGSWRLQILI